MPRRRVPGEYTTGQRVGVGIGQGLSGIFEFLLKTKLAEKSQERTLKRQQKISEQGFTQQMIKDAMTSVAKGEYDPTQADSLMSMLGVKSPAGGFASVRPTPRRRLSTRFDKPIADAKTPEDVPSIENLFAGGATEGLPNVEGLMDFSRRSEGQAPLESLASETPLTLQDTIASAGSRRTALENAPTETVTGTDPLTGAPFSRRMSNAQLRDPFQTGPSTAQQATLKAAGIAAERAAGVPAMTGQSKGEEARAAREFGVTPLETGQDEATKQNAVATLTAQTKAKVENLVSALTRGSRTADAASVASATTNATLRAGLQPDVVAGQVAREGQMSAARRNNDQTTEGERRAATNLPVLIQAHANAKLQEDSGIGLQVDKGWFSQTPTVNRMVSGAQQQLVQGAMDYVTTLGFIRSGVTVREDEIDRFLTTMFRIDGDSSKTVAQKQRSRETFIAATQISAGRSSDEAGKALAELINIGSIPASIIETLQFTDPKFQAAFEANLKNLVK